MWYIVGSSPYRVIECGMSLVRVLIGSLNVVYRWFESLSGQTNDYNIGFSCFSSKHADLGRKSEDWLARNQNKVSA